MLPRRQTWLPDCSLVLVAVAWLAAGPALAGDTGYRLSPGDVVSISVYGEPQLSTEYPISPSGTISLALIGEVELQGLTVERARETLTEKLRAYLKRPYVTVSLNEARSTRQVYVLGAVKQSGLFGLPVNATAAMAVAAAGGLSEEAAAEKSILTHPDGGEETLNLVPQAQGLAGGSARLRSGDVLYIPRARNTISLVGALRQPGRFVAPTDHQVTLLEAITSFALGPADPKRVGSALVIPAEGPSATVDLRGLLVRGDVSQDRPLKAGDIVVVSEAEEIRVVGQVMQPTAMPAGDRLTLLDALIQANGPTPKADLRGAYIARRGQRLPVDILAALRGEEQKNVDLQPGDVLWVPEGETQVIVAGEVKGPGAYTATPRLRLVTALQLAGGTTERANVSEVRIIREGGTITANLQDLRTVSPRANIPVMPGDVIVVPPKEAAYALGYVTTPGTYPVGTEDTLLDLMSKAGGVNSNGDPGKIYLSRAGADGRQSVRRYGLSSIVRRGPTDPSIRVKPGDVIYVGRKGEKRDIVPLIRDTLWPLVASVTTILRLR